VHVLLVPNTSNPIAVTAACELATWLSAQGFDPILSAEDATACSLADFGVPVSEIGEPGLTVALGGDGTILKAVHLLPEVETPVLGVNLGRLGFMAGATIGNMRESVSTALAGEARVEKRSTLEATVYMDGREVGRYRALNEIALTRGASPRVIKVETWIGGFRVSSAICDGVIVATPTGSTAYAMSAGGPIVSPTVRGLVVVPVAPHTLAARPIVTGASDVVEVRLTDTKRADSCVVIDGESVPCRRAVERIEVMRGGHDVLLLKCDGRDFYEVAATEFLGG
jgi:NAD+ kinase